MKALDLFCGAGGASMGLHLAGFAVTGCDINPQPRYPFELIQGNALDRLFDGYDLVWASPPCQKHSALRHLYPQRAYECFIERIRSRLQKWGGPWIIENVPGSPLINPVQLCGSAFGLRVRRHRLFESNMPLIGTGCRHKQQGQSIDVSGTGGRRVNRRPDDHGGNSNKPRSIVEARNAMGIDWMTRKELSQAIPPVYSMYLGAQAIVFQQQPPTITPEVEE